jgi:hypothetical protein
VAAVVVVLTRAVLLLRLPVARPRLIATARFEQKLLTASTLP